MTLPADTLASRCVCCGKIAAVPVDVARLRSTTAGWIRRLRTPSLCDRCFAYLSRELEQARP